MTGSFEGVNFEVRKSTTAGLGTCIQAPFQLKSFEIRLVCCETGACKPVHTHTSHHTGSNVEPEDPPDAKKAAPTTAADPLCHGPRCRRRHDKPCKQRQGCCLSIISRRQGRPLASRSNTATRTRTSLAQTDTQQPQTALAESSAAKSKAGPPVTIKEASVSAWFSCPCTEHLGLHSILTA